MAHVAAEMEREGFEIPLLIGGATTSRVHTAVKIHPRYERGQTVYVTDASRAVGVVSSLLSPEAKAPLRRRRPRRSTRKLAEAHARAEREKTAAAARGGARQRAPRSTGPATRRRSRPSLGTRVVRDLGSRRARALHRLDAVLPDLGAQGPLPGDPRGRGAGRGGAAALRGRAGDARPRSSTSAGSAPRAVVGFWPANAVGDDIRLFTDESRGDDRSRRCFTLRQQRAKRGGQPNVALADFVAPRGHARLRRRLRGHRRHRGGGDRRALRARERRLFVDPGQGARRPLRRGLRRAHARAGAPGALGLRARRGLHPRGAGRRALPRHPAGAGLSGAARPHREGDAVPAARRRRRRPA